MYVFYTIALSLEVDSNVDAALSNTDQSIEMSDGAVDEVMAKRWCRIGVRENLDQHLYKRLSQFE